MTGPVVQHLSGGARLHLRHGPIDLIIGADGERDRAFRAAERRFATVLSELVGEMALLRAPVAYGDSVPAGETARIMDSATRPFAGLFVTRMAAVAGAVAETILAAMVAQAELSRAYVNNGGDVALHLSKGQRYASAMMAHDGRALGTIEIDHADPVRGIATSGRHGRSLSLGIADSVTVLAANAARADSAATLIANAVDLPGHPAITRKPACDVIDDSDLGALPVVTACGLLSRDACLRALNEGDARAADFSARGLIAGASLHLHGETVLSDTAGHFIRTETLNGPDSRHHITRRTA